MINGDCPVCHTELWYERFGPDVKCPECGAVLRTEHECWGGGEDCLDWLEVLVGDEPFTGVVAARV